MSIEKTDIIDVIGEDEEGNVVLTISDHLEWDSDNKHLLLLQEKINTYLAFIESGEIYQSYSIANGKKFVINIVCKYPPEAKDADFLSKVSNVVDEAGFGFHWNVAGSDQ